jgi:hypothetical protein
VSYQRRFGLGLQPAVAVLGAVGLLAINQWMPQHGWGGLQRRAANYGCAALALTTSVLVYISVLASAATNRPSEVYPWTHAEADAGRWLGSHSDAHDVVMASTLYANALVGVIDGRVVHGHIVATRDSDQKAALVAHFYAADTDPAERLAVLRDSAATVVGLGPGERALGASEADLAAVPGLVRVYDAEGVVWYRVQPSS